MQGNPAEEWQHLTEHYHAMFDGELEDLALNMDDLTETAREVLRNEMKNRGLALPGERTRSGKVGSAGKSKHAPANFFSFVDPDALPDLPDSTADEEQDDSAREYSWKVPLCECETSEEAWQLNEALKRAGIDSWVRGANSRMGGYPKVLVAADQLDDAVRIASQPIPQDIIEESKIETPEYVPPVCPECGAEDPVLESAEPANSWLCEACGAQWTDPDPVDDT